MTMQPDQSVNLWDNHVSVYESLFEPFSLGFARAAAAALDLPRMFSVLDVCCGPGGAALELAASGCRVAAIDGSMSMIARTKARAASAGLAVDARVMDGMALDFTDASLDAAFSVFGVILFPDAIGGLREMVRVVRPGGKISLVTWTEPQNYELAALLRGALLKVDPDRPASPLPAQLRFREKDDFAALFAGAGLPNPEIVRATSKIEVRSAAWLAANICFAPGMSSMIDGMGGLRSNVLAVFVETLERRFGKGPVALEGVAFVGTAVRPHPVS